MWYASMLMKLCSNAYSVERARYQPGSHQPGYAIRAINSKPERKIFDACVEITSQAGRFRFKQLHIRTRDIKGVIEFGIGAMKARTNRQYIFVKCLFFTKEGFVLRQPFLQISMRGCSTCFSLNDNRKAPGFLGTR